MKFYGTVISQRRVDIRVRHCRVEIRTSSRTDCQRTNSMQASTTPVEGEWKIESGCSELLSSSSYFLCQGKIQEALDIAESCLQGAAHGTDTAAALVLIARCLQRKGEDDKAMEALQRAVREDPSHSEAKMMIGKRLEMSGDVQGAIAVYSSLPETDGNYLKALLSLAHLHLKIGNSKEGVRLIQEGLELNPEDAAFWQLWGVHEWKMGRYKAAKNTFEKGMKMAPAHSPLLVAYAKMEAQRRNRTKARSLLRAAVECNPKNSHAWLTYASLEGRIGNTAAAVDLCSKGLSYFPNNVYLLCTLGQIHASSGNLVQAIDAWERALEANPESAVAAHELGNVALKNGEFQRAKEYFMKGMKSPGGFSNGVVLNLFEKFIKLRSNSHTIIIILYADTRGALRCGEDMANIHMFYGDYDKARDVFESMYASYRMHDSRFLREFASFEKKSGNLQASSKLYEEAASHDPRDERTWLQWSLLEKRRKNHDKAIKCVQAGLGVSPLNPFLWQVYGSLAWDYQSPAHGREVFSKGLKKCPKSQQLLLEWSLREIRVGRQDEALEILRLAEKNKQFGHIPLLQLWASTAAALGYTVESKDIEKAIHRLESQ